MNKELLKGLKKRGITLNQYRQAMNQMYRRNHAFRDYKRSHHHMIKKQNRALNQILDK